jgi:predicted naringenin-chalcone synthase
MSLVIRAIGTAVPLNFSNQAEAVEVAKILCCRDKDQAEILPSLYRHSGINKRHMVFAAQVVEDVLHGTSQSASVFLPTGEADDRGPTTGQRMRCYIEEALPLAVTAARRALDQSGASPAEITHLITVTCTGFSAPGIDFGLIRQLPLRDTVERVQVGFMGCHGAINGLRVARAFSGSQPEARVLLCAVELCSVHYFYRWDPKRLVANALFADGAAALVGVAPSAAASGDWIATATGSCLFPKTEYAMTWDIGDRGFEMTLSTRVPALIAKNLRGCVEKWLHGEGLSLGDIKTWAVHPGGPRILDAVEEGLALPPQALAVSREILAEYGNMSSPTILFVLQRLRERQAPRPCVALGFGPGLAAEGALFR